MGFWNSLFKKSADNNVTNINAFTKENNFAKKPGFTEEFASDMFNTREEFASEMSNAREEFASELSNDVINNNTSDLCSKNGVCIEGTKDSLKLVYNGILAKDGATDIYAVVVQGDNVNWEDAKYYPMNTSGYQTYELLLPVSGSKGINIAFKDGADNWDNNSGENYRLM
jgi:hypothetical protein